MRGIWQKFGGLFGLPTTTKPQWGISPVKKLINGTSVKSTKIALALILVLALIPLSYFCKWTTKTILIVHVSGKVAATAPMWSNRFSEN